MNSTKISILGVGQVDLEKMHIEGIAVSENIDATFDVVAVFPGADAAQLFDGLFAQKKLLCPIINLTGSMLKRQDFTLDSLTGQSWDGIDLKLGSILDKIRQIPEIAASPDYIYLACLALSYTREQDLVAQWNPALPELVDYPLLAGMLSPRDHLEELKSLGLLSAYAFDRVHICPTCQSSRLNVREECVKCHSSHLNEHSLIHHYRCAYQGISEEFEADNKLICPKCTHELRHYGVDYDRPGNVLHCAECSAITTEPAIGFICSECRAHTAGDAIKVRNWSHFKLTPAGQNALMMGKIPKRSFSSLFEHLKGVYNKHDFIAISLFSRQGALRYKRDLSAYRVDVAGLQEMRQSMGNQELNRTLAMLAEIISEVVRTTDAVTILGDDLFMLMPETPSSAAEIAFARIDQRIKDTIAYPIELKYRGYDLLQDPEGFIGEMR